MNSQTFFRKTELTEGQADNKEGLVLSMPSSYIKMHVGTKETSFSKADISIMYDSNAYIYCFYTVTNDEIKWDKNENGYTCTLSWDNYLCKFWNDNVENELLITPSIDKFINEFERATNIREINAYRGFVNYDLDEKIKNSEYFEIVKKDGIQAVYSKLKKYEDEREYRFAIVDESKPSHVELNINTDDIIFYNITLRKGKSIVFMLNNIQFGSDGIIKSFSKNIGFKYL